MRNRNNSGVVEDIWMNTQVAPDDLDATTPSIPDATSDWDGIKEANAILNPDAESMDWRG